MQIHICSHTIQSYNTFVLYFTLPYIVLTMGGTYGIRTIGVSHACTVSSHRLPRDYGYTVSWRHAFTYHDHSPDSCLFMVYGWSQSSPQPSVHDAAGFSLALDFHKHFIHCTQRTVLLRLLTTTYPPVSGCTKDLNAKRQSIQ